MCMLCCIYIVYVVLYLYCVCCVVLILCMLCCTSHSGKEERLQPIARSLNYKSINQSIYLSVVQPLILPLNLNSTNGSRDLKGCGAIRELAANVSIAFTP